MSYSTTADVENLIKWTNFSYTSTVGTPQLNDIIEDVDAEINGRLSEYYQVPVTDEQDQKLLRYISSRLSAYEVAKILISQAGGEIPETVQSWKDSAENRLERIVDGELVLANTEAKPGLNYADGLYSHTSHSPDAPDREWGLGEQQW